MGRHITTPPTGDAARLVWAMNQHIYMGLCPDEVDGWDNRDSACMACYYTNRSLRAQGFDVPMLEPVVAWEDALEWEVNSTLTVARVMAQDEETYTVLMDLMEAAALSRYNGYVRATHLGFVQAQCSSAVNISAQLRLRGEQLSTMYFMGADLVTP